MKRFNVLFSVILLASLTCSDNAIASKKRKQTNFDDQQSSSKDQKTEDDDKTISTAYHRKLSESDEEFFKQLDENLARERFLKENYSSPSSNSSSSSSSSDNKTYTPGKSYNQQFALKNLFSIDPMQRKPVINLIKKHKQIPFGFGTDEEGKLVKQNHNGNTLLHLAAQKGFSSLANLCIHYGDNISAKNSDNKDPLDIAIENKNIEMEQLLLTNYDLFKHTRKGNLRNVIKTHLTGASVNAKTVEKNAPLHYAAYNGNYAVAKFLLDTGAHINAKDTDGFIPLHIAAFEGHEAIITLLLNAGALVNTQATNKLTPLHCAAQEGHEAVVTLLLEADALVNAQDNNGNTPLHFAAMKRYPAVVQLLLDAPGADRTLVNHDGKTALTLAQENDDLDIFELFQG